VRKNLKVCVWLILLALVVVFAGVGCAQTTSGTTAAAETTAAESPFRGTLDEVYYMNVMVSGVEYWVPVYEGMKDAARQLNVQAKYSGTPEYDVNKQLDTFEQILATNPKGILVHPIQPDPFIEPINRAIDNGIAVVTFAADSPNSKRQAYITSDNEREGILSADFLAEAIGGEGEVATLENPGQLNHDIRVKSFIKRIEENWPNIKVVGSAASNQDPDAAYNGLLTIAQKNPGLDAVFMPEASSGMGAGQAAKELGGNIKVMCCDVNEKVLDMIKAGDMFAALNPNQYMQGYFGMLVLYVAAHPELVDPMNADVAEGKNPVTLPFIDNDLAIVTKENADYFYLDKYLERRNSKGIEEFAFPE